MRTADGNMKIFLKISFEILLKSKFENAVQTLHNK